MRKTRKFFIAAFALFIGPSFLNAQVIITEIMYDIDGTDSGREWIEIKNTGNDQIDLSEWKLFEANTNHKINAVTESILNSNNFAIIADDPEKFKIDNPKFAGLLFDSTFSLNNTGENLILRDESLMDIDSVLYVPAIGAQGDSNSLQKTSTGKWTAINPTPGMDIGVDNINNSSSTTDTTNSISENISSSTSENSLISSHSSQSVIKISYDPPELEVSAGRYRLGFVGTPMTFESETKSTKNIPLGNAVSNVWSMGDGAQKFGQFISHIYEFPGDYIVILNSKSGGASAVAKVAVKIIEPRTEIISANTEYIEIANRDYRELNLGNFVIETRGNRFIVPPDTIIYPYSSLKLPSKITKLSAFIDFVRVVDSRGKIITTKQIINVDPLIIMPEGLNVEELSQKINQIIKK